MSGCKIYRAKWVFPMIKPPIENGAVAVANGKILRAGNYQDLKEKGISGEVIDCGEGVLMPALVNAHAHLELPPFTELPASGFVDWLKTVIEKKQGLKEEQIAKNQQIAYQMLEMSGTGFVANVKNFPIFNSCDKELVFWEFLGLKKKVACQRWPDFENVLKDHLEICPAAHAAYSVWPEFLVKVKKLAQSRKQVFAIHVAESEEEVRFLKEGQGALWELLRDKGLLDLSFKPPGLSPVAYLAHLGILDINTLCVHCVEVDREDVSLMSRFGVRVCLCPRSNYYLGLKDAPWSLFKQSGLLLCLGTDSLASNQDLNLFKEMSFLLEKKAFSPSELLEMATWKSSVALGQGYGLGTLFPGAVARLIFIPVLASYALNRVAEAVIYLGAQGRIKWIS